MLLIFFLLAVAQCKLVYVATVFRHGARHPIRDIIDSNQTKELNGKLTSVGMRQQFLLGGYLKSEYIDKAKLINSTLYPKEVEVFSDSSERCVESAISHLVGLFPFGTGPKVPDGLDPKYLEPPFQKLTKDSLQKQNSVELGDFALKMGFQPVPYINATQYFPPCPNETNIISRRLQSLAKTLAEFQVLHAAFTQKMRIVFNLKTEYANIAGLAELYDVVICDLNLGRQMPTSFTDYDFKQLKFIQNYLFALTYGGHVAPIFSTAVVNGILNNMKNIVLKGQKQVKRYSIYSGHDTNVVPLLLFFNLTNPDCITKKWKNETVKGNCAQVPPFASNIIFQLHQNETTTEYSVKIRYNGDYYNLCQSQSKECSYKEFVSRSEAQFVDVAKQCNYKQTPLLIDQ